VVAAIAGPYASLLAPGTGERPLGRRFVDDSKVTDHHAIIPTAVPSAGLDLTRDERHVYGLVCRRTLMAWHDEHVFAVTTVVTSVASGEPATVDRFHSSGTMVQQVGWKALELAPSRPPRPEGEGRDREAEADLPPGLAPASRSASPGSRPSPRRPARRGGSPTRRSSPPWRRPAPTSTIASCRRP